uniref:Uncharacterized protein n=1 Tax=Lepeophtheirus salmonis TaxID=72036 RepID=A0A0K2UKK5_LEPSM
MSQLTKVLHTVLVKQLEEINPLSDYKFVYTRLDGWG